MKALTGEISSPGFLSGQSYPNNVHCQWVIDVPYSMMVQLTFTAFDVEHNNNSCSYDKLEIWENEPQVGTLLHTFCGTSLPGNVSSHENLVLDFRSDRIGRRSGFRAVYELTHSGLTTLDPCPEGRRPCGSGLCVPDQWFCDGEQDCRADDDEQHCEFCQSGEFQCSNHSCVPQHHVCDGIGHCSDLEDEEQCVRVSAEGVLEVSNGGQWFPVCNDTWTPEMKQGACAAAGLGTGRHTGSAEVTSEEFVTWTQEDADMYLQAKGTADVGSACPSNQAVTLNCSQRACGRRGDFPQPYVLGSHQSVDGQWPWTVALVTGDVFRCGGSLIADRWVLTAGHCIHNLVHLPETLSVISGQVNLNTSTRQETRVTEVTLHPENNYIYAADIALLRLQRGLSFTASVRPACLPRRSGHQWSDSLPCYVSGWGITDIADMYQNKVSSILHHAKVKLWNQEKCLAVYPSRLIPSMICAGYEQGEVDACKGDSGGPLVCRTSSDTWTQVGVVSWGEGCGTRGKPGVYTRVDSYLDWIHDLIDEGDITASCDFERPFMCGYSTDVNATSSFLWSRRRGGLALPKRPVKDHTYNNASGHYMYTHIPDETMRQSTSLYTPRLHVQSVACVTFNVLFFAQTDAFLTIHAIGRSANQSEQLLLLKDGDGDWSTVETEIDDWVEQIAFRSNAKFKTEGGIAVDDVTVVNDRCSDIAKLSCDFNEGTMCQYEEERSREGGAQWTLVSDQVTQPPPQNSSLASGAFYIETNFTGGHPGDTTKLISPNMTSSVKRCLHFRYQITPPGTVTLSVCTLSEFRQAEYVDCSLWGVTSSPGSAMVDGKVSLTRSPYPYSVVFQASSDTGGVVRLDDIVKIDGSCD